jgi:hypothetical protein
LTSGGYLAVAQETMQAVYLVNNGQKRHVTSPAVMDKFWFNCNFPSRGAWPRGIPSRLPAVRIIHLR